MKARERKASGSRWAARHGKDDARNRARRDNIYAAAYGLTARRRRAGNVVIWSGEDDPADTLVPRLIAAGAYRSRIYFVKGVSEDEGKCSLDPAKDMGPLSQAMERIGDVKLVIIDPIAMVAGWCRSASERRDAP